MKVNSFILCISAVAISFLFSCRRIIKIDNDPASGNHLMQASSLQVDDGVLTGFNQNWNIMPCVTDTTFISNLNSLSPEMIRYPGGTVTHKWNWQTGKASNFNPDKSVPHLIGDVKTLADATGAKIIFVLDILHSSLQDQINMLHAADMPIEYIELGNELYAKKPEYVDSFPDGRSYAVKVNTWATTLKDTFDNVQIAALLIGKYPYDSNPDDTLIRMREWNTKVVNFIDSNNTPIDAYTYHIYIPSGGNFEDRMANFDSIKVINPNKQIWITEYGIGDSTAAALPELTKLADYVESTYPIALNHEVVAYHQTHTKLTLVSHGHAFTDEGTLFVQRATERNNLTKVVFNKVYNSQEDASGTDDAVELLTVKDHLNMSGMILKNFTNNGNIDSGARYTFTSNSLWSDLRKGTLIIIRKTTSSADTNPSDFVLDLNIGDGTYFTKDNTTTGVFDVVDGRNMWMLKEAGSGTNGVNDPVHTLFGGASTSPLFGTVAEPKLYSHQAWSPVEAGGRVVYCKNTNSLVTDFNDTTKTQATGGNGANFPLGTWNNATNETYITHLRAGVY